MGPASRCGFPEATTKLSHFALLLPPTRVLSLLACWRSVIVVAPEIARTNAFLQV
jgi:hypothetical protein